MKNIQLIYWIHIIGLFLLSSNPWTAWLVPGWIVFTMGLGNAAQTLRSDRPEKSIFWRHTERSWKDFERDARNDEDFRALVRRGEASDAEGKPIIHNME